MRATVKSLDSDVLDLGTAEESSSPHEDQAAQKVAGASELQARLADAVRVWDPEPEPHQPKTSEPADRANRKTTTRRIVKTLLALAIAIALGWTPLQRFLQTTSAEATVNARLVTLRAPIDGEIVMKDDVVEVGSPIQKGDKLLQVVDSRADTAPLDGLRRQIFALQSESDALEKRLQRLDGLQDQLRKQRDAFQQGRIEELEARFAELSAEIQSAEAQQVETSSTLNRTEKLHSTGYQSEAALIHANRDHKVATSATDALRQRLKGTKVELDAARQGLFVGDSYNDIPRTAQRLDEVAQQVIELGAQLEERKSRIAQLQKELTDETKRLANRSSATVNVPIDGRVWEVLTSNGEQVSRGQELLRVLDCSGAVVTAAVSEAAYNDLKIGQAVTFHLRGESEELKGKIIGLNGLAAAPANLAIEQNALAKEPYHVTVQIPTLSSAADCYVGRTGKVTFDTSGSGALAANP
jgi:multidrug resistance efflux pump